MRRHPVRSHAFGKHSDTGALFSRENGRLEQNHAAADRQLSRQRIDLRALGSMQRLGGGPLAVKVRGGGAAVVFRYGAVVLFDVQPLEQDEFLRQLEPRIQGRATEPEIEEITVRIDPDSKEVLEGNTVILKDTNTERLEIVADILSKSVVLARYESSVAQTFDRIEPFAAELTKEKTGSRMARELPRATAGAKAA